MWIVWLADKWHELQNFIFSVKSEALSNLMYHYCSQKINMWKTASWTEIVLAE